MSGSESHGDVSRHSINPLLFRVPGKLRELIFGPNLSGAEANTVELIQQDCEATPAFRERQVIAADLLGRFLAGMSRHLERCECSTEREIADWLTYRLQVMRDVYLEVGKPKVSPDRLKRLALRLVIDPRVSVNRVPHYELIAAAGVGHTGEDQNSCPAMTLNCFAVGGILTGEIEASYDVYDGFAEEILRAIDIGPAEFWSLRALLENAFPGITICSDDLLSEDQLPNDIRALRLGISADVPGGIVTLHGVPYAMTCEGVSLIAVLIEKGINLWHTSKNLSPNDLGFRCPRPGRVVEKMPPEVQKWIELRSGFGTRLRPPKGYSNR